MDVASLVGHRVRVGDAHYDAADMAWRAFRADDPDELDRLARTDVPPLPFLRRALLRFLQEYAWTRDGLSRSERRLLHLAAESPVRLSSILARMHGGEDAYFISDLSLLALARALSTTSPPLATLTTRGAADPSHVDGTVTLTAAGRAVLAGEIDRVTACGIDRWFGGVHLTGTGPGWRWDDALGRLTRTPSPPR